MNYELWDESELQAGLPVDAKCLLQAGEGRAGRKKVRSWSTRVGGCEDSLMGREAFWGHFGGILGPFPKKCISASFRATKQTQSRQP